MTFIIKQIGETKREKHIILCEQITQFDMETGKKCESKEVYIRPSVG
jgi:hypothetical protein